MKTRHRWAHLVLYGARGELLKRRVPAAVLADFCQRALRGGGAGARLAWERLGALHTQQLLPFWPRGVGAPRSCTLRSPRRFLTGLALQVEVPEGAQMADYAANLLQCLSGGEPLPELHATPVDEALPPPARPPAAGGAAATARAPAEEPLRPAAGTTSEPAAVFDLLGATADEESAADGKITAEDLPWLSPGDRIVSQLHGRCRVLRVSEDAAWALVRSQDGSEFQFSSAELLAEFWFEEEP